MARYMLRDAKRVTSAAPPGPFCVARRKGMKKREKVVEYNHFQEEEWDGMEKERKLRSLSINHYVSVWECFRRPKQQHAR
mmetsp:Transcript_46456/g.113157  ORF Transcript_46456/g.113157 Transcript_46456/m.113157 type:complete len:80 (+) Transcript_46456:349-588(+)